MSQELTRIVNKCARGSLTGEMTFPEIVECLAAVGVERYHADYTRQEATYYTADGNSLVVAVPHDATPTPTEFSRAAVAAAVQQSQRGEHSYPDFVRKTMTAGCIGYFVQITGRRVIYFGRNGESHVELFPSAVPKE